MKVHELIACLEAHDPDDEVRILLGDSGMVCGIEGTFEDDDGSLIRSDDWPE